MNYDFSGNGPWFVHWSAGKHTTAKVYDFDLGASTASDLYDVAGASTTSAWAVGWHHEYVTKGTRYVSTPRRPLVLHWNGKAWQRAHTPFEHMKNTALYSLSVLAPNDVWAVGDHLIARYSC